MKNHPLLSAVAPLFADGYALLSQQHGRALMARARELSHSDMDILTAAGAKATADTDDPAQAEQATESIAVISMIGILTKYPLPFEGWDRLLGLCPCMTLIEQLQAAVADAMIETIVVVIDSPGGFVNGSVELADAIAEANKIKPVIAIVTGLCCSGAYWSASQCRTIIARPESQVGNIGVYSVLVDDSKFWEEMGVTFKLLATGEYKGLGADGKITPALEQETQRTIDSVFNLFVNAVAAGRGITPDAARALADGRAYLGAQAKQFGLIDDVATSFAAAIQASTTGASAPSKENAMSKQIEQAAGAAAPKVGGDGETDPKAVFDKTTESANDHKDQARAAMDAAGTVPDEPDDDTTESAKQCVAALESCADESARAADALSEKFGLDDEGNPDPGGDEAKKNQKTVKFTAKDFALFGDAGFRMFYEGKSFASAAKEHIVKLEAENASLKKKLNAVDRGNEAATFQAEPSPAANGKAIKPGKFSASKEGRTFADGGTFGDGRGLDRFAAGIKMPGSGNN